VCEDERLAYELQIQLLGCTERGEANKDHVDMISDSHHVVVDAFVAQRFAEDAALAEADDACGKTATGIAQTDFVFAQSLEQHEMMHDYIAQMDRELANTLSTMPEREWNARGDLCHHPSASGHLSRMVQALASSVQALKPEAIDYANYACDSYVSNDDTRLVDATTASSQEYRSKHAGKAPARSEEPTAADLTSEPFTTAINKCMVCMEELLSNEYFSPIHERRPQIDEIILARYKPRSNNWQQACVLGISPSTARIPWVKVVFKGYADQVVIPYERMKFMPTTCDPAAASSSTTQASMCGSECGHFVCRQCMRGYLKEEASKGVSKLKCCFLECEAVFPMSTCEVILASDDAASLQRLRQARDDAMRLHKVFCANPRCSIAFDAAKDGFYQMSDWPKVQCPECSHSMCVECKVPWHSNVDCTIFQKLPDDFRDQNDIALLQMSKDANLRGCPGCQHLIERQEGDCNWMHCVCGCKFCYGCGAKYKKHEPTANNVHGTAGCKCSLFDPFTAHADEAAILDTSGVLRHPIAQDGKEFKKRVVNRPDGPYQPGAKKKVKFLNKMPLLPVPCKFATTSAACPWGKKCWYRHTDDDGE
ncbi:hypothetical protein CYMTET_35582, partial [Cymbomonas tetramitiformis]